VIAPTRSGPAGRNGVTEFKISPPRGSRSIWLPGPIRSGRIDVKEAD